MAKCDSYVSHGFSDTPMVFNKFDYEGKRGKQAVSGKEKVLETPLNIISDNTVNHHSSFVSIVPLTT